MGERMNESEQCREMVYVRDAYRVSRRGKQHNRLHYNRQRCSRRAGPNGYCWQHPYGLTPAARAALPFVTSESKPA